MFLGLLVQEDFCASIRLRWKHSMPGVTLSGPNASGRLSPRKVIELPVSLTFLLVHEFVPMD